MDNIQKLILGVLSVAGMIAMLVPSGDPVAPPSANAAAAVATIVETPAPADLAAEEQLQEEADLNEEDVFLIGEPAIDGNPIQSSLDTNNDTSAATTAQFAAPSFSDYAQPSAANGQAEVTGQAFAQPLAPPPAN